MALRVTIEDLVTSGVAVAGHGEDMAIKHSAADTRIESAHSGWQGESATALSAKSAAWIGTTSVLLTRMSDHAQSLHASAHGFRQMESRNSQVLVAPGQAADAVAASTD